MASTPEDAVTGFQARAQTDTQLKALLGTRPSGNARVEEGFPAYELTEERTPLVTHFLVTDSVRSGNTYRVRLQVDIFVWPVGTMGGRAKRALIDARILELFKEAHWIQGDSRLYSIAGNGRNTPTGPDEALRKTRDWEIFVSPRV